MNKSKNNFTYNIAIIALVALIMVFSLPLTLKAATSSDLSCALSVTVDGQKTIIKKQKRISVAKGKEIQINWEGKNVESVTNLKGEALPVSGYEIVKPTEGTTFTYLFKNKNKTKTKTINCSVSLDIISADIDEASLSATTEPVLKGKAAGLKNIYLTIKEENNKKYIYKSKSIKVKSGKWEDKISKKLLNGNYEVILSSEKDIALSTLATGTLTIGKKTNNNVKTVQVASTLVVSSVPLLTGGISKAGATVPLSYLQITNTGKEAVALKGFNLKQNGSASTASIIGFTTVDDSGTIRATTGGTEGLSPFNNGQAFASANAVFAPGQIRLFTIKGIMSKNVSSYLGTELKIDVESIESNSAVKGAFPIRGTTWKIGF